ncbi:MAG: DEAD/DEAH box helicase family protein [Bacilli bacterium]|nr:DEAD/DEAH box helicase family protein [Bacilli bacterium]
MDLSRKICEIISQINKHSSLDSDKVKLLQDICELYDDASKSPSISENEMSILYFFANIIGVPQYFDLLCEIRGIENRIDLDNRLIFLSMVNESNLYIDKDIKVHFFQKELIDSFDKTKENRYLLSASTSFGKTFVVYNIIQKMKYNNIVLIFPTISLLTENLQKIMDNNLDYFSDYNKITLSEETMQEKNILIFTPERFMTFIDKNPNAKFDFVFIDEIYKIDGCFINENLDESEKGKGNESKDRDISFRIALEMAVHRAKDILLAGPFLNINKSESIKNFVHDNHFIISDYNKFDLVKRDKFLYNNLKNNTPEGLLFGNIKKSDSNTNKLLLLLTGLHNDQTIIYCQSKYRAEEYALKVTSNDIYKVNAIDLKFKEFISHLESTFGEEWCLVKALKKCIGIHHGTIPKYIQKEIINFYNTKIIRCIFSTTTITEGVNTSAKNMIILSDKKGKEKLKKFDILNIIGRAGRFTKHFSGRVFIISEEVENILSGSEDILKHKNYMISDDKKEADLKITRDKYLSQNDKKNKITIKQKFDDEKIPEEIRKSFLMISSDEKIKLYKLIKNDVIYGKNFLQSFISKFNVRKINNKDMDELLEMISKCIDQNDILHNYLKKGKNQFMLLTYLLMDYFYNGFRGLMNYEIKEKKLTIDRAIRNTSYIVYSIFRYELVKHISIMDLIYRTIYSEFAGVNKDEVESFKGLLSYLEYGAYTEKGRKASDFGVPFKVLEHIENNRTELDNYEKIVYEEVKKIL